MSRRRKTARAEGGHDGPDERWMASYLDMITVLMCLFIVLYAMSSVEQEKFDALRDSLATGFGQEQVDDADPDTAGLVLPEELQAEDGGAANADIAAAVSEIQDLQRLQQRIEEALDKAGASGAVQFTLDERGLTLGVVGAETFFQTASKDLSPRAVTVLDAIGPELAGVDNQISIEGHADKRPTNGQVYETNWELSSSRATEVLRHLVEQDGITGGRVQAVGFGDARPVAEGDDANALAQNRRVDIVIQSDEDESVRSLIPRILDGSMPKDQPDASGE